MEAIKPNKKGMMMAELLRKGRDLGNYPGQLPEGVPLVGGMGVGDLLFGQTPEMTEDWAHGFPPTRGQGFGTVVKPEAMDYLGLPLAATGGALANRALIRGLRSAGGQTTSEGSRGIMGALQRGATEMPTDESRRKVLQGMGALGAVAAMPKLLRGQTDNVLGDAAVKVAPKVVNTHIKISRNIMERMYDNAGALDNESAVAVRKVIDDMDPAEFEDLNEYVKTLDWTNASPGAEKRLVSHPDTHYPEQYGLPDNPAEELWIGGPDGMASRSPKNVEAIDALRKLTPQELGNWVISGKPPKSMEPHLQYIDLEDIGMAIDGKTPISFNNSSSDTDWMLILDEALETNSRNGGL